MIIPDFYRPSPKYPTYPPYHTGLYLEDYFYDWSKDKTFARQYIPIFWTNLYCDSPNVNIQYILDRLPKNDMYFTVCQHDDAPKERLPNNTLIFSAGGKVINEQTIPIPLVCSQILNPELNKVRDVFASFVGTPTHPIRRQMYDSLTDNVDYQVHMLTEYQSISNFNKFKNLTERSKFTLCPRGYGPSSFRLYESIQLGSVPVYISDYHYLPFIDEIDWNKLCVLIKHNDISNIDNILRSISNDQYDEMVKYGRKIYNQYFTLNAVCEQIKKRV